MNDPSNTPKQKISLKESRLAAKERKEQKRFNREIKNCSMGLTAKGYAFLSEAEGNESAFDLSRFTEGNR